MPLPSKPILADRATNGESGKAKDGAHNYAPVFEQFGFVFGLPNSTGEAVADACPWCSKNKFYLNVRSGQYHCKHCSEKGNATTFLTWVHARYLEATTDDHYRTLKQKRGIALQPLKRHGLAYDPDNDRWLIPFKSAAGSVVNIQRYYPNRGEKPDKFNLPGLPTVLYGLDRLSDDKERIVFLCEGPFDAIALDAHIGTKRAKYDIVATPGTLQEKWVEHFRGRKVRALYDNDKGGDQHRERVRKLLGESGIAAELRILKWPAELRIGARSVPVPPGCDINDLVRDPAFEGISIVALSADHGVRVQAEPKLMIHHGRRPAMEERPIDWIWPDHVRCGTYVSFSGRQGTFKSTIAQQLAALYTTGRNMPMCDRVGLPPGHVLYVFAEDNREEVENGFEWAGGDFNKWHTMPAVKRDGDPLNILEHLGEIEATVREYGIRLVIVDGQNSVVGAPNISTDMQARVNVTNKLHQFAQRLNLCLIGIRNEDAEGRALGPQSFGDIGRCVMRTVQTDAGPPPYCVLRFVKVSDAPREKYPDVPYSVADRGGSRREILWGKVKPKERHVTPEQANEIYVGLKGGAGSRK
ncbi:-like protein : Uncharacterized protein OS=Nitrolancea hollandica Lb GN=NITHO_3110008 PE=4 SV=1: Toprim_2: AAA_25 [Gemmata massiliana]|uniref:Toprim domain-containing protein n=1 Tax=Gemmata massiliana TaxID=1210884 RepID=A0A6P2DGY6_9BACT|nr:AAA family ATPase [Gemmata massiliana]VTS01592.1 -like protein : Uncharacterized protein OS=Nitrolancea hollandica Lb GN=NITHO_3110008 PE=4 SV=1: Toprim_2: AAA_25 [Gemmata massiliana]